MDLLQKKRPLLLFTGGQFKVNGLTSHVDLLHLFYILTGGKFKWIDIKGTVYEMDLAFDDMYCYF